MLPDQIYSDKDAERIRSQVFATGFDKEAQDWLESLKRSGGDLLKKLDISPERGATLGYGALGGALGGGLLTYLAARQAQRHRHPRDRTSVLGQTLAGAVLGGMAVPTGMEAWRRLQPSYGRPESKTITGTETEKAIRGAPLTTAGWLTAGGRIGVRGRDWLAGSQWAREEYPRHMARIAELERRLAKATTSSGKTRLTRQLHEARLHTPRRVMAGIAGRGPGGYYSSGVDLGRGRAAYRGPGGRSGVRSANPLVTAAMLLGAPIGGYLGDWLRHRVSG